MQGFGDMRTPLFSSFIELAGNKLKVKRNRKPPCKLTCLRDTMIADVTAQLAEDG